MKACGRRETEYWAAVVHKRQYVQKGVQRLSKSSVLMRSKKAWIWLREMALNWVEFDFTEILATTNVRSIKIFNRD